MKNTIALQICLLATAALLGSTSYAEETKTEKVEAAANKAVDSAKKSYRKMKSKACETIDGKLECDQEKLKNHAKNISDKIKTDTKELKNKID